MPGRDHLTLGVVEVLHGVADDERQRIGVSERVPDDVEPVAVAELGRLVPLVRRQPDGWPRVRPLTSIRRMPSTGSR